MCMAESVGALLVAKEKEKERKKEKGREKVGSIDRRKNPGKIESTERGRGTDIKNK